MRRWPFAALCWCLTTPSLAAAPLVEASGCGALDTGEVGRLLTLELASLTTPVEEVPPFSLQVSCAGSTMTISLFDPATSKRVERVIPAPAESDPGRERVLALAASQLVVASWLELLVPDPPVAGPAPVPAKRPSPAARHAAATALSPSSGSESSTELGVVGGVVWRDRRAPFALVSGGLKASQWYTPRWGAGVETRFEAGRAHRATGSIDAHLAAADLGVAARIPVVNRVDIEAALRVGVAYLVITGNPRSGEYRGRSASAYSGQAGLGLGPVLHVGKARLGARAELGALLVAPRGGVAGDRPVQLQGLSAGALLSAAWAVE